MTSVDNIVHLPPSEPIPDLLVGPFKTWKVRVEGRIIPGLTGFPDGDKIALVVDGRFSASFSKEDAHSVAWLLANALAVGAGYPWLGAPNKDSPFAPEGHEIG